MRRNGEGNFGRIPQPNEGRGKSLQQAGSLPIEGPELVRHLRRAQFARAISELSDVDLETNAPELNQGLIWNGANWVPGAGGGTVLIEVRNQSGSAIARNAAVYVSGEHTSGKPLVDLANASDNAKMPAIGLVQDEIPDNTDGYVIAAGSVEGLQLDPAVYNDGDALYVSASTPGALTRVKPTGYSAGPPEVVDKVQKVALVTKVSSNASSNDGWAIVMGAGRVNDQNNEIVRLIGRKNEVGVFDGSTTDTSLGPSPGAPIADNSTIYDALTAITQDLGVPDGSVTAAKLASGGQYHGAYDTEAETARSGATAETIEVYYTARPDGDGYAESEVTTSTPAGFVIERKLYFSDKFNADPDTASDWTLYTTQPAENTAFATAKASLLAGLSDTDGTANTRGTLPVSLKMTHRFSQDLLLEDFPGAAAGYSLRKISTNYTGSAIRIREDGTNTEKDISFDSNGDLNTADIAAHCGSNNGFVVTWYDQSGNNRDATAAADTNEPKIYDGTTGVHTTNGKPALQFDGTSDLLDLPNAVQPANINNCSAFTVQANTTGFGLTLGTNAGGSRWYQTYVTGGTEYFGYAGAASAVNLGTASTKQKLVTAIAGSTQGNAQAFVDGVSKGTSTLTSATPAAGDGKISYPGVYATGDFQEVIVYHSDQSANRTDIEADISAYWTANKRLLDSYPGPEAAYSVRKLDNDYSGPCMRVRNVSTNATSDIGFDSNGDLDESAIATLCGSANGAVEIWYDQSGNGHHQIQETTTLQGFIYLGSSGAVLKENGKPTLVFTDGGEMQNVSHSSVSVNLMTQVNNTAPLPGYTFAVVGPGGDFSTYSNFIVGVTSNGGVRYGFATTTGSGSPDNQMTANFTVNQTALTTPTQAQLYAAIDPQAVVTAEWESTVAFNVRFGINYNYAFAGSIQAQEYVIYYSDKSSDQAAIEDAINGYYGAYT